MEQKSMRAMVKGSIYETGEYMSVFGTCMDGYDTPLMSNATFSGWYPNGTMWFSGSPMVEMSQGYFVWQGNMNVVGGTYLTEMICTSGDQTAKAWGEWQNPVWVNRIAPILDFVNRTDLIITDMNGTVIGINATVSDILLLLQNLTGLNVTVDLSSVLSAISNLSIQISQGFNNTQYMIISSNDNQSILIGNYFNNLTLLVTNNFDATWAMLSQNFSYINDLITLGFNQTIQNITYLQQNFTNSLNYTNSLIAQTQIIANSSVDRNNSYLATLIMMLINHTGTPVTSNLTWVETYQRDQPPYWHNWWIKVDVYNEYGREIVYPDVICEITTSSYGTENMGLDGNKFKSTFFIDSWDFNWSTNCY
jgi:hypothetical protein